MVDILRGTCGVSFRPTAPTTYPPEPTGLQLVAIPRGRFTELRLALENPEDGPYISVRVYKRDRFGLWWPGDKGFSIQPEKLAEVVAALRLAADVVELEPVGG